jgi:hypothetical protein
MQAPPLASLLFLGTHLHAKVLDIAADCCVKLLLHHHDNAGAGGEGRLAGTQGRVRLITGISQIL